MWNILGYFDLNRRRAESASGLVPISPPSGGIAAPPRPGDHIPIWQEIVYYLGTVVGVLVSSAITQFKAGTIPTLTINLTTVVVAIVIALVIIPNFYAKVVKEDAPFIVQLGLFVQNGVFWSVALTAIGKAIS
jgi:hypothetical protein